MLQSQKNVTILRVAWGIYDLQLQARERVRVSFIDGAGRCSCHTAHCPHVRSARPTWLNDVAHKLARCGVRVAAKEAAIDEGSIQALLLKSYRRSQLV